MSVDKSYQSELYFDVVIKCGAYKGWKANFVGIGRMTFIHPDYEDFNVKEREFNSKEWMKECWDAFIKYADEEG